MDIFRNLTLRRALSIVILFAALFTQIQTLYACDAMEGEPKHVCCCDGEQALGRCAMANTCDMNDSAVNNQCCQLSYDLVTDAATVHSASTAEYLTLLLDGPQPPPDIEFQPFSTVSLIRPLPLLPASDEQLSLNYRNQSQTYFFTRRLRL